MDKLTTYNHINKIIRDRYEIDLQINSNIQAMIYKQSSEDMYKILDELYSKRNTTEDFVKKSIEKISGDIKRIMGFSVEKS